MSIPLFCAKRKGRGAHKFNNMNLSDKIKKVKEKIKSFENELIIVIVIILVALISFGLGRLSKIRENKALITIENAGATEHLEIQSPSAPSASATGHEDKLFVASKSGTKYHYPWCPGALNIKEENKIWFSSKEQAEAAGYTPASNCKGL